MSSKKADISQIRKYLNGELNAKAMHQLEHEALDDPFLMDALEGYETNGNDQQHNLDGLAGRLQQRSSEKKGRVIPWRVWSIAASILVVLTIGGLWLRKTPPAERERVADIVPPQQKTKAIPNAATDTIKVQTLVEPAPLIAQNAKPTAPVLKKAHKLTDNAVYQQEISAADSNVPAGASGLAQVSEAPPVAALKEVNPQEDTNKDKTQRLSEAVVMGYTSQSSFTPPAKKDTAYSEILFNKKTRVAASPSTVLLGRVPGLTVIPADRKSQAEAQRITGIILSKDDGMPVIGAAIRVKGTNRSTVTNTYGHFSLPVVYGNSETLDIASIGYERKQVSVKGGDSLKVELKQAGGALNEVVVAHDKKDPDDEPAAESAHPQNGWSSLKKYLQENAFLPDGTTGNVSVTFMVATDGTLSDLKIKKSLNAVADQKAIDLIKAGPSWIGNNNRKPEEVTVKVKFQKQK